ncbi:hypothetical protein SAMN04487911_10110 [Arenibacter nanhaiticus]|uniref:Glutaminyl-tRNA synthetase n=1 Tax=Arenibacter nanhaiticus TaxID=558155 RepID=A0A1M6A0K7_9FLAO|nr:DUF6327 family protein [Arenibacter nanhaiticus]SHI29869.1 hypothetical protein SAMN04487911_10110 [Arenibacter nanhaiticus]
MRKTSFNSFEEIDTELKVLKLQKNINKELIRFNVNKAKATVAPKNLLGGVGGTVQKVVLSFVINKILKKIRR